MRVVIAALLVLALAMPAAAAIFTDLAGHPLQQAIERLAAKGIVRGTPDGRFLPADPVTRVQLVVFLTRVLGVSGQGRRLPAFRDLDQIPEDARPAVAAALSLATVSAVQVERRKGAIQYTLTTDKPSYGPDDTVLLTFVVTNTGREDVAFEYTTSQFHDFIIRASDGTEVARWSLGRAFLPVDAPVTLAAGRSLTFQTRWRQLDQNDNPVEPGRYEIIAVHTTRQDPTQLSIFYQRGLVAGYPDNTFQPNRPVTRAELAVFAVRAGGLDTEAFARAGATLPVPDAAEVPDWARGSVAVALERKMLPLVDGAFRPARPATRADTAAALDALMVHLKRYDFIEGVLRSVQMTTPATITVADERQALRTYRVASAHAVYRNGQRSALSALRPGDTVRLLMPSEAGDVVYIEASGR